MNRSYKRAEFIFISCFLLISSGCTTQSSFVGLNREEVVKCLEQYPRFYFFSDQPMIMLCCNSVFKYYSTTDEILNDEYVMTGNEWDIAFEKTFLGKKYIKVFFCDNIVVKQKEGWLNDWP